MKKDEIKRVALIFCLISLCYLLFESETVGINLDRISMIVFLGLSVLSGYFFFTYTEDFKEKYIRKKAWIFTLLIAMIMAFIIAGQPLFLNQVRIYITLKRLLFYSLLVIWCVPVELFFLYLLEKFSLKINLKKVNKNEIKRNKRKVFWICFMIFMSIWTIVFIGMFPGTITSDSVDQYLQALGVWDLNNSHPVLMTLLLRASLIIIKNPAFFIYLQIIFFAFLLSSILSFLYEHGLSKIFIYTFSFLFSILPSSYLLVVSLWKDVIFTVSLLWMTYLVLKLVLNEKAFFKNKINFISFIISTMLVSFFRHNGIGPFVFVIIYFIYKIIRTKNKSYVILTILLLISYGGIHTLNNHLCPPVDSNTSYSPLTNLVTRSSGQILQTSKLPKYTEKVVTHYGSLKILKSEYDQYNVDSYGFNEKFFSYQNKLGDNAVITTKEAFIAYMHNLFEHPLDTIKERLDGADILWNMKQPDKSFNHRYGTGIWLPANLGEKEIEALKKNVSSSITGDEAFVPNNKIYNIYTSFAYKLINIFILDNIVSRGAVYIMLLFIVAFYLFKNNRKLYPIYIPMLGNTATWVLLLAFQAYRYIWYIEVITVFIILFVVVFGKYNLKVANNNLLKNKHKRK